MVIWRYDIWLRTILIVRKETCCHHIGYSYRLTARVLLYAPSHRQDNTYHGLCYTSRGALAGMRNSSMGPPHEGLIRRPIAPWANALPLSYVPLLKFPIALERWFALNIHGFPGSMPEHGLHKQFRINISCPLDWSIWLLQCVCVFWDYIPFQPVPHDWCNKGRGVCYPVCGMVHIKEPLVLFGKSSLCGGNRFPLSLYEWSFTICPTPYNRK